MNRATAVDDEARWKRWTNFLCEWDMDDARLDQIDERIANEFAIHLDRQELTRHSKLRILALLKNVFARFADDYGLATNPFSTASSKLSNHQADATEGLPDKREPFSPEDIAKVLGVLDPKVVNPDLILPPIARRNRREYFALNLIMLGTGLRLKDAVFLQHKQIKGDIIETSPFKTRWRA
jgi:integrase